jgi:hypothetical protein
MYLLLFAGTLTLVACAMIGHDRVLFPHNDMGTTTEEGEVK